MKKSETMSSELRWQRREFALALQPWCLADPKASIIYILKNKIGNFDKELNGIILDYKNVKILHDLSVIRQDSAEIHTDIRVDFLIFQPYIGAKLQGVINKKCVTHLSVLVHGIFNVVIPRPTDNVNAKWIGDQLEVGQKIFFTIVLLDLFGALPYIRGALDESSISPTKNFKQNDSVITRAKLKIPQVNFDETKPKHSKKSINLSVDADMLKKEDKTINTNVESEINMHHQKNKMGTILDPQHNPESPKRDNCNDKVKLHKIKMNSMLNNSNNISICEKGTISKKSKRKSSTITLTEIKREDVDDEKMSSALHCNSIDKDNKGTKTKTKKKHSIDDSTKRQQIDCDTSKINDSDADKSFNKKAALINKILNLDTSISKGCAVEKDVKNYIKRKKEKRPSKAFIQQPLNESKVKKCQDDGETNNDCADNSIKKASLKRKSSFTPNSKYTKKRRSSSSDSSDSGDSANSEISKAKADIIKQIMASLKK